MGKSFTSYFVQPNQLVSVNSSDIKSNRKGKGWGAIGCSIYFLFMVIMGTLIPSSLGKDRSVYIPLFLFIAVILLVIGLYSRNKDGLQTKSELNNNAVKRMQEEADDLTTKLRKILSTSLSIPNELQDELDIASKYIKKSRQEFSENAFDPYWDCIEKAALAFEMFRRKINLLSDNVREYYNLLKGKKHNFPKFPVSFDSLSDSTSLLDEFHQVVRLGQTNPDFAIIWNHRKTREVIISGFNNLFEGIDNLSAVIQSGFSNLQDSLESNISRIVDEEINIRDSITEKLNDQDKKLDNIQRGRKPFI